MSSSSIESLQNCQFDFSYPSLIELIIFIIQIMRHFLWKCPFPKKKFIKKLFWNRYSGLVFYAEYESGGRVRVRQNIVEIMSRKTANNSETKSKKSRNILFWVCFAGILRRWNECVFKFYFQTFYSHFVALDLLYPMTYLILWLVDIPLEKQEILVKTCQKILVKNRMSRIVCCLWRFMFKPKRHTGYTVL